MLKQELSFNHCLDEYLLNVELSRLAGISTQHYRYWASTVAASYLNDRAVFLKRNTLPKKYAHLEKECSDLKGLVTASAFCACTQLARSHLNMNNNSALSRILDIKNISGFVFVDFNKFLQDFSLSKDQCIYIEKCSFFAPQPLEKRIKLTSTLCLGYY